MNKSKPNEKELKRQIRKIADMSGYYEDEELNEMIIYHIERLLFYKMIELTYSGNLKSAYKLCEMASKKYGIPYQKFRFDFDRRKKVFPFFNSMNKFNDSSID